MDEHDIGKMITGGMFFAIPIIIIILIAYSAISGGSG